MTPTLHAEGLVDAAHPFGVALGQVIVDGDHVDALAAERVEVAGQGGDQRLAFAGLHFGDLAVVQHHAADQLHVEMAHVEEAAAGLADHREGFDEEVVERGALRDALFEFDGLGGEVDVRQLADRGLEIVDGRHRGLHAFDLALGLGAKDFRQDGIDNHERSRYGGKSVSSYFTLSQGPGMPGPYKEDGRWERSLALWGRLVICGRVALGLGPRTRASGGESAAVARKAHPDVSTTRR